jgi:predicted RND superfamily exporter protein
MLTTTLVAGTGFLGFLASPFIPLRDFGLLISGSLWLAVLCDLVLLPLLILFWKK